MGVNTLTEEGWQTLAVEFADGTSYFVTQIKQPAENLNIYDTIHCLCCLALSVAVNKKFHTQLHLKLHACWVL